jgi:hypothetical protein
MQQQSELEQIKQALSQGRLTVPDSTTGYQRSLYARCPGDGKDSYICRIERFRESITRVVFCCTVCGKEFDAGPESMLLR